jgi:hypothetical protein
VIEMPESGTGCKISNQRREHEVHQNQRES